MGFSASAFFTLAMLAGITFALPLSVSLISPSNGETITDPTPSFSWVATGGASPELTCSLYIDGKTAISGMGVVAGGQHSAKMASLLPEGTHKWFVSCWDITKDSNFSETRTIVRASVSTASIAKPSAIPVFVTQSGPGQSLTTASFVDEMFSWPTVLVFPIAVLPAVFLIFLMMSKKGKEGGY
jgi:hypothetical protein